MADMLADMKRAVRQADKPYTDFSSQSLELCSEKSLSEHKHSSPICILSNPTQVLKGI